MTLTPQDFVSKWRRAEARERQSVQEHFIDLCALVGQEVPMGQDPSGTRFEEEFLERLLVLNLERSQSR